MKPITVKELMATLSKLDPSALVGLSTDSEGNSYSLIPNVSYVSPDVYMLNELGSQEYYFDKEEYSNSSSTVKDLFGNKTDKSKLAKCVLLWPSN